MSASAVLRLATLSSCSYSVLTFCRRDLDFADGAGDFAQVAQENAAPLAFLLHLLAAAEIHAELAADGLQAEAHFFLNFGIAGDRFFRFAGERHPDAGHVDHDGHRPAAASCRAIALSRSYASWCR